MIISISYMVKLTIWYSPHDCDWVLLWTEERLQLLHLIQARKEVWSSACVEEQRKLLADSDDERPEGIK